MTMLLVKIYVIVLNKQTNKKKKNHTESHIWSLYILSKKKKKKKKKKSIYA